MPKHYLVEIVISEIETTPTVTKQNYGQTEITPATRTQDELTRITVRADEKHDAYGKAIRLLETDEETPSA